MSFKTDKNLSIWNSVDETDTKYTKADDSGANRGMTSINGIYMVKRATEIFGSIGIGWGYNILEERLDDGFLLPVKDLDPVMSKTHTIKIELWYKQGEEVGKIVNYGHTKYIYRSKYGATVDEEAPKKSLTDAIKKCLSMLGFCADVYLGQFDDREYVEELNRKSQIEHADDKDAERLSQIKEHKEWLNGELKSYSMIDDPAALKTVYTVHMRKVSRRNDEAGKEILTKTYETRLKELSK